MKVSYDSRAVLIDGKRTLIISGAVHYPRSVPEAWPSIIRRSRQAGLNCIETYVFWEGHQPQEGLYDFTGRFDIRRFLNICASEGMYVILRIGPYVCAEWNFGGLPWWLLRKEGLVTRTWNEPFMREVENWLRVLMAQIRDLQATRGGPIILAQLENEYNNVAARYGADGQRYLEWIVSAGRDSGLELPLIMCEGAGEKTIETLNGFSVEGRIAELRKRRPDQPVLWTENWPGWYDTWGFPHHTRDADEIAYRVARFFAAGGSGVNYYMWHGGTNFGRDSMYLQTTSYDFDAPLDEYGLPTAKSAHLAGLHKLLHEHAELLMYGNAETPEVLVPESSPGKCDDLVLYRWRKDGDELAFLCNGGPVRRKGSAMGKDWDLPPTSAVILGSDGTIYKTWGVAALAPRFKRRMVPAKLRLEWFALEEPVPDEHSASDAIEISEPSNMLPYTRDETDYAWYLATVRSPKACKATLKAEYVADVMHVWVNGVFQGLAPERLVEDRRTKDLFRQTVEISLKKGENRLAILAVSLGLIKGDWMLDAPQSSEKKGLCGPIYIEGLDGIEIRSWRLLPGLSGERRRLWDPNVSEALRWQKPSQVKGRLRWYLARFELGPKALSDEAPWALDAEGLGKGLAWVNGWCIGRYWSLGPVDGTGPTQRYYHIPPGLLKETNTLVLFEERGALPTKVGLVRRK